MKKIRLAPSGKEIEIEDDQTILSALESAGYAIPNNCRAGACGECKTKICSGEIDQGFVLDMALPRSERDKGQALICMAKQISDVIEIEYATDNALPKLFPPQEDLDYILIEKTHPTEKIVKLKFRSLDNSMRFWPGQYILLGSSDKNAPKRCYSIVNTPNSEGEIILYISKVDDGKTSKWIHEELFEGDLVKIDGPYGTFIGDPTAEMPVLCLAAGSGLAPINSLATAAMLRGGFKYPATIIFSAKKKSDLIDLGHFRFLEKKFRNFSYIPTLTKEKNKDCLTGRISSLLPERYKELSGFSIYIAGSTKFVTDCEKIVISLGAQKKYIHSEKFIGQGHN